METNNGEGDGFNSKDGMAWNWCTELIGRIEQDIVGVKLSLIPVGIFIVFRGYSLWCESARIGIVFLDAKLILWPGRIGITVIWLSVSSNSFDFTPFT